MTTTATIAPANAASGHRPVAPRRRRRRVDDRKRRTEPRSAGDAEQVRVAERVPEHALIRGARDREHPADERRERDARCAQLPEHGVVDRSERLVDVEERDVRERRAEDRADADVHRPDREADRERNDEERRRRRGRRGGRRPAPRRGVPPRLCLPPRPSASASRCRATVRANCTIRGPQREATSSFAATTRWC